MAEITGQTIKKQYSLKANLVRQNTETGKDLREDLPISIVLPGELKTKMSDLGGYEEAKVEVIEYVNYINHQERYKQLGARLPKGALLCGPPGTGKTLLAKATAGAANIPFIAVSSSSLLLGSEGPTKMRKIFQLAYSMAPCVVFFDEIDAIGRSRNHKLATPQTQCVTEELLVQLDGFNQEDKLLIVLASTNLATDLDDALTRPGRFDRIIKMPPPDQQARIGVLQVHLKPITTSIDKTLLAKRFGMLTSGMTGAQIASMCNEAAMIAARDLNEEVRMEHFEQAFDRVRSGVKKKKFISKEEKQRSAAHDAAHAIAGWFLDEATPPTKLCILPNGNGEIECSQPKGNCKAGLPDVSKKGALNAIAMTLAGAAAEQLLYGEYFTGCCGDFNVATEMASMFVVECGYPNSIGKMHMKSTHSIWGDPAHGLSEAYRKFRPGPAVANVSFDEIKNLLDICYAIATNILKEKEAELKKVTELVLAKELVTLDMLVDVLGPSPHIDMEALTLADENFLPMGMQSWNTSE